MVSPYLIAVNDAPDALTKLKSAIDTLQKVDAKRLLGDRSDIDGAIIALLIVRGRIYDIADEMQDTTLVRVSIAMSETIAAE